MLLAIGSYSVLLGGRTLGILSPADLDELLDVGDFARHDGQDL